MKKWNTYEIEKLGPRPSKKPLGVFKREWTVFETKRTSLVVKLTRTGDLCGSLGGNFGIGIMKEKRSIFTRIGFWFERISFKNLTIEELRELSTTEQKKYLYRKYHLYGITPYLLNKVERTPPRDDDPLNQRLPKT